MRIRLVWVGRTREAPATAWIEDYVQRIARYGSLEILEVKDAAGRGAARAARENRSLLERVSGKGIVVALDEAGEQMTSLALARFLDDARTRGQDVSFVLGGPEGLPPGLLEAAERRLSLSRLTLTHEMARVLLLEQIYRAFTILGGSPYHR